MIYFLISLLNILLIFLIRILIKKNIFIKSLAYITVICQILVAIISIVRERNFENNFFLVFGIFFLSLSGIFLVPLVIDKLLSAKKRSDLINVENNLKISFLETYHEFVEKYNIIKIIFSFISQKILVFIKFLIFSNNFFLLIWIPWLTFVNFLLLETVVTQKFIYSPYCLAYFFVLYRAIVLALYVAKNTQASFYIKILRQDLHFFMGLEFLLDFNVLKSIVLNSKITNLKDKIQAWKDFNLFLFYFIDGTILSDYFYIDLTELKKHIDALNFSLVLSISFFFFSKNYFSDLKINFFIFLLIYSTLVFFFIKNLIYRDSDPKTIALKFLLTNLVEFLSNFKWVLIKEHQFSYQDTDEKLITPIRLILPISAKTFIIKSTLYHILFLWVCFSFCFFDTVLVLDFLLSISYFEPFFFFI